ncbi:MAG: hypothetical protein RLZZ91_1140 [Bacteroidota bacterium]|jgi:hypothetical protein
MNNIENISWFKDKLNTEFLILKHEFNPIEWVETYFLFEGPEGLGIYSKCIELEGSLHQDDKLKLRKSLNEQDLMNPNLLQNFCAYWAANCGGFNGSISFVSSTVISKEAFDFFIEEKKRKEEQIRLEAQRKNAPIVQELVRLGYSPSPSSFNSDTWTASCLFHKSRHMMWVDTKKNECRCAYGSGIIGYEELKIKSS